MEPFPPPPAPPPSPTLQANLAAFALAELVRQHRASFPPLWTVDSWAKLLIWLALNAGCAGDTPSLEAFAASLGAERSAHLRRLFFSRELEPEGLRLWADPAEGEALLQALEPTGGSGGPAALDPQRIAAVLEALGLHDRLAVDPRRWQWRQGVLVIPFQPGSEPCS